MKIIVLKFGGTSVGTLDRIVKISKIIISYIKKKYKVIVVTSAMSGVTNELLKKAGKISKNFPDSERDVLLSTGEQMASALIAGKLYDLGFVSRSWMSWQIPIITGGNYSSARILKIGTDKIKKYLKKGGIPIITGFQGLNKDNRITTLERGGSDASAIMLAKFFKAKKCIIYTDVDGVYTTDPNVDINAKKISKMSYEEMLEMASTGSKVLHTRSVELAMKNNLTLQVLSSLTKETGTFIVDEKELIEKEIVSGVSYSKNEAKVTISGILDKPGISAKIFSLMSENNINVDMIVQNISQDGISANITFTISQKDFDITKSVIEKNHNSLKYKSLSLDKNVAKISVIGMGMMSQAGVAEKMFKTLAKNEINILAISTSEIKISVLIEEKHTNIAVKSLHEAYNL